MNRSIDTVLQLLALVIVVVGWVTSQQAMGRGRQETRRSRSRVRRAEIDTGSALEPPPNNWPDWAVGKGVIGHKVVGLNNDGDLDEGVPLEQGPLDVQPLQAPEQVMVATSSDDADERFAADLVKGMIWSEILQPPLALRGRRR